MKKISVLMSVYNKEQPAYLDKSLESLYLQTYKIDEIVIVKDGILTSALDEIIEKWKERINILVLALDKNYGLGVALQKGLLLCNNNIIARMDSDDISVNNRFERQIDFLNKNSKYVLVGAQIKEFSNNINDGKIRKVPAEHNSICKFIKTRNPFNHMTVMFKKDAILSVGGYIKCPFFEDYHLWHRLINEGFYVANLDEVLVYARIGNDMIGRRHGFNYLKYELEFFKDLYKLSYYNKKDFFKVMLIRLPLRLLPKRILEGIYSIIRKKEA